MQYWGAIQRRRLMEFVKSLKLLSTNTTFQMMAAKFYEQDATIDVIKKAGEVAMVLIYGGSTNEGIDTLRYKEFQRKISIATSFVNPQEIPQLQLLFSFTVSGYIFRYITIFNYVTI
jgi:hypothetical protein